MSTGAAFAFKRPEARTEKVEDLVQLVLGGQIRIPEFQRGLAWDGDNVVQRLLGS